MNKSSWPERSTACYRRAMAIANPADILEAATGQRNVLRLEFTNDDVCTLCSMRGVIYGYDMWFYVQVWRDHDPDIWVCFNPVDFNDPSEARAKLFGSCVLMCGDWTPKHGALTDNISEEEFTLRALEVFE